MDTCNDRYLYYNDLYHLLLPVLLTVPLTSLPNFVSLLYLSIGTTRVCQFSNILSLSQSLVLSKCMCVLLCVSHYHDSYLVIGVKY